MATPQIEAVVAGTKGFALALLAPIAQRIGAEPRVAADPAEALLYCQGRRSIVVVEFLGEDSLGEIQELVLEGGGLRIVAAVPPAHFGAEGPLRALGVDAVRWDGTPDHVLGALERQIAFVSAPPARRVASAAPAPRAAPAPAAGARPALTPTRPLPAVAARPAAPGPAVATALTPSKPHPAVAATSVAGPALTPSRPLGAVSPRPSAGPVLTPSRPQPAVTARSAAGPALTPSRPLGAVSPRPSAGPALTPSKPQPAVAARSVEGPALTPARPQPAVARAAPAPVGDAPWPTEVPGAVDAADALGHALLGGGGPGLLAVASDVVASLSELERAVFSGQPQPFDTEAIRRAAVMRVRVAVALSTAPAPGDAVDPGAVSAFLAEIDALLSDVNALAAGAPPDVQASLEAMRNALVKEAIDFSEAVQRAAPAEAFAAAPAAPRAPPGGAPETRLLQVSKAEQEAEAGEASRQRRMLVVLGIAVAAAAAFHGYRYSLRMRGAAERPTRAGLPGAVVMAAPGPMDPTVLRSRDGQPFTKEELSRIVEEERLKGNAVRAIRPDVVLITPAAQRAPKPAATPSEVKP